MSLLACVAVVGAGCVAALLAGRWLGRDASRAAREAQHHAPPYVHRVPGGALPDNDGQRLWHEGPTDAQIAAWETDDVLDAANLWSAWYPPGSLGDYPDGMPGPGALAGEPGDVEDLLTGVIRHLRSHAPS